MQEHDQAQRLQALEPFQSFAVSAPAGSGKTELLAQRVLRLLGIVENPEEIVDKSAALVLRVFDLVDPEHDGKVKKLDFLKGVQTPEVQEAIRTHPQFSALLHTHTYRDAMLAIETKDGKYINVQEITRFANSL